MTNIFSNHDFICLFISLLRLADIQSFQLDEIENNIIKYKYNPNFKDLLNSFDIKYKAGQEYSPEYYTAIKEAAKSGLIYNKLDDIDFNIYINDIDIISLIKDKEEYIDMMKLFINQIYDLNYESEFQEFTNYKDPENYTINPKKTN